MTTSKLMRCMILFGCLALSLSGQTPARAPKTPIFISPSMVDAVVLISAPPALTSKKMSKDLAEIFAIHRSATPQEIEGANWDNQHENIFAIAKVLGDNLTMESLPVTAKLWAHLHNDQSIFLSAAKRFFHHPRPYDLDPDIKSICGSKAGGPKNSYPSGHGTVGYLSTLVLSMKVPERRDALLERADEYAS